MVMMKLEQILTPGLAEAAYYLECGGEAAIIDPLRDPLPYIRLARENGAKIRYILETHFHADFVGGHRELAEKTGATIVFGPTATPLYKTHIARDGEIFPLGKCSIRVLHTPGHSLESTTYLLRDENGKDHAIFTGDTLFVDDVGRPDLVQQVRSEQTPEFLAGLLYDSLRNKIMPLADDVLVYPGHGQGSICGRRIGAKPFDTLGRQKQTNFALGKDLQRDIFIQWLTENPTETPVYFPFNILMNVQGDMPGLEELVKTCRRLLKAKEFRRLWELEEAVVIDARHREEFLRGHLPGSISIGPGKDFVVELGNQVKDIRQPILMLAEKGRERDLIIQMACIGYHNILGFLEGGFDSWLEQGYDHVTFITQQGGPGD